MKRLFAFLLLTVLFALVHSAMHNKLLHLPIIPPELPPGGPTLPPITPPPNNDNGPPPLPPGGPILPSVTPPPNLSRHSNISQFSKAFAVPSIYLGAKTGDSARNNNFACFYVENMENNRSIRRRGCVRRGVTIEETCNKLSNGSASSRCMICDWNGCNRF